MTVYRVEVDVAHRRPPRVDDTVHVIVDGETPTDADLTACQIAACDPRVVMPVGSRLLGALDDQEVDAQALINAALHNQALTRAHVWPTVIMCGTIERDRGDGFPVDYKSGARP